jgi:hypothetical protein
MNGKQLFVDFSASLIGDLIWRLVLKRLIILTPLLIF